MRGGFLMPESGTFGVPAPPGSDYTNWEVGGVDYFSHPWRFVNFFSTEMWEKPLMPGKYLHMSKTRILTYPEHMRLLGYSYMIGNPRPYWWVTNIEQPTRMTFLYTGETRAAASNVVYGAFVQWEPGANFPIPCGCGPPTVTRDMKMMKFTLGDQNEFVDISRNMFRPNYYLIPTNMLRLTSLLTASQVKGKVNYVNDMLSFLGLTGQGLDSEPAQQKELGNKAIKLPGKSGPPISGNQPLTNSPSEGGNK
jgi:hypothetical protein